MVDQSGIGSPSVIAGRLERIESAMAHVQHDIDGMQASLLHQLRRLTELESRLTRLVDEITLQNEMPQRPDAADERPPHY
jgi:uncharacterized coiled-coil protein SlyX